MSKDQGSSEKSGEQKPKTHQVLGVVQEDTPEPPKTQPQDKKSARFSWTQLSFSFI
jgi:hypothetical protein